jgi:hypothetical protein
VRKSFAVHGEVEKFPQALIPCSPTRPPPGILKEWVDWIRRLRDKKLNLGESEEYAALIGGHVPDDQQMLHQILERHPRGRAIVRRYFGPESKAFNYDGDYIVHLVRADNGGLEERLRLLDRLRERYFNSVLERVAAVAAARQKAPDEAL